MKKPRLPETSQHESLRVDILSRLPDWRWYVVAIDGLDGVGKSSLARYLAWQSGIALVETDLFLLSTHPLKYRYDHLSDAVDSRRTRNRPLIVEGIQILQTLEDIDVKPDYLVIVEASGRTGSHDLAAQFDAYKQSFEKRLSAADFNFRWAPKD